MGKTLRSPPTVPERSSKRKKPGTSSCSDIEPPDNAVVDAADDSVFDLKSIENRLFDLHGQYSELFTKFESMAKELNTIKVINQELLAEMKKLKLCGYSPNVSETSISSAPTTSTVSQEFTILKQINLELLAELKNIKPAVSPPLPVNRTTPSASTFASVVRNNSVVMVKPKNSDQKSTDTISDINSNIDPSNILL